MQCGLSKALGWSQKVYTPSPPLPSPNVRMASQRYVGAYVSMSGKALRHARFARNAAPAVRVVFGSERSSGCPGGGGSS